ncbi:hypothetical protein [Phytohabitans houttuyneae]|uniref:hypothetical protein n=1 Tax=Phytohabitans houttuyneae TaxID=1076126 RepID=UPI001FEC357E|nr:hypothetical protein [Phytohabitans houttuyneae]
MDLATQVVPYIAAAAGAYGTAVIERVRDSAADATVEATAGWGRRLLGRILRRQESAAEVEAAVRDLAQDPDDADRVAAVRLQVRKALADDPELAAEVAAMLQAAGTSVTASGPRSVAVQENSGIIQTGDSSSAWQQRRP